MSTPALAVSELRKSFASPTGETHLVLDVPELRLEAEEQVALHGTSGTGKTTLLHLIAGISRADSGSVRVAGEDVVGVGESARDRIRARHVGYVFQTFNLLQGFSVLENVELAMALAGRVEHARAAELLRRVGLEDRLSYRPAQLSVGQQQRVAVARALANRPALVLADEPTGNLDPASSADVLDLLKETCREQQAALLLVSHEREVLDTFDRVEELARLNRAGTAAGAAS